MCDCLAKHRENGVRNEILLMKDQRTNFYSLEMNGYEVDAENFGNQKELDRENFKFNLDLENELEGELGLHEGNGMTEEDDIYSQLAQKEKDLLLAAELGKALLERNEELSKNNEALQEELTQRTEELEQEKHELRLKLERLEGLHESRVHELQADLQALRNELNSVKSASVSDLENKRASFASIREENERLHTELQKVKNDKDELAEELASAKKKLTKTKSFDNGIHTALEEVDELHEKLQRLSEERSYLEQTSKELAASRNALTKEKAELLERNRTIERKLAESKTQCANFEEELDESKLVNTSLLSQLEEIKMQASFGTSLYSELSMIGDEDDEDDDEDEDENNNQGDDKAKSDKVFTAVGQSLKPVQSLDGNPKPLATSSSISVAIPQLTPNTNKRQRKASSFIDESDNSDIEYDEMESSITSITRDSHVYSKLEAEALANAELKREVFETHSELTDLYEHLRSSCESLRSLDDINMDEVEQNEIKPGRLTSFVHSFKECVKELAKSDKEKRRSVDELKVEVSELKKNLEQVAKEVLLANSKITEKEMEIEELQLKIERQSKEMETLRDQRKKLAMDQYKGDLAMEVLYSEIGREREEALKRESDIAQELARTKKDNAGLDEQLLEAIHQKIELSEQLEQWQYDMASLIDDQVKKQMKTLAKEQEALRNRKRLPFSKSWNWSSSHRRQNVQP